MSTFRGNSLRIEGVNIKMNKSLVYSLQDIYGIGLALASEICDKLSLPYNIKVGELTEDKISDLRDLISSQYSVEGDLRRKIRSDIQRLISLKAYRGLRHKRGYPVRGQRTHTNAKTCRKRK